MKVRSLAPATKIDLDVLRDGATKKFTAVSGQRPGIARSGESMGPVSQRDEGALKGVAVGDIDPQARRELNIPPQVKGAVITEVEPDSVAARRHQPGRCDPGDQQAASEFRGGRGSAVRERRRQEIPGAALVARQQGLRCRRRNGLRKRRFIIAQSRASFGQ